MKKIKLFVTLVCIAMTSCNSDEIPNNGEPFARANQLQLYYSSDTNSDLLDLNNNTILPITYEGSYIAPNLPPITDLQRYDYNGGVIKYDTEIQKYYWNTAITGKQGNPKNRIYVKISEIDTDTLDVKFKFTKGATGGNGNYAYIEKLYYNGTLILEENSNPGALIEYKKRVFIQKKGNKTVISRAN